MQPSRSLLTELDRAIVAALHLSPRAPWELLARSLGASESTVARRAARLFDSGQVAVVGLVDRPNGGHGVEASVRLRCQPGTVDATLRTLADHDEVRFAGALTGAPGVLVEVVVADHGALLRFLERTAGALDGVTEHSAAVITGHVTGAYAWDPQVLEPDVAGAIVAYQGLPEPEAADNGDPLTAQEAEIVAALGRDGRMSVADLASAADTSPSTVRRRLESLSRRGVLHFRTVVEPAILGFGAEYMLWLDFAPARVEAVAGRLAAHPATRYLVTTSGEYALFGSCVLPGHEDLPTFLATAVPDEPAVRRVHTQALLRAAKRHWRRGSD